MWVCSFLDTVEAFDPRAGQWQDLVNLAVPRAYCASATVNGKMVVAGGMAGTNHAETVRNHAAV